MNRLGQYVASKKTMRVRGKVWSEIFDALEKARPDIKSIVAFQNEALSITRTRK
jgi:3'-phosphoadenosine 5'-phosphosulfate sulfotransferase